MTSTLVRQHVPHPSSPGAAAPRARARDWAEIQERMLVPLYEAVYERLEVGAGTRLLGLGCGSGLALLMAAARGAAVCGVDPDEERLELARERLLARPGPRSGAWPGAGERGARLVRLGDGGLGDALKGTEAEAAGTGSGSGTGTGTGSGSGSGFTVVTAFEPLSAIGPGGGPCGPGDALSGRLAAAAALAEPGSPVVLAGWGPPERCATSTVLRVGARLADPMFPQLPLGGAPSPARWQPSGRDDLEHLAQRAGLRPDGSGRVACPFGYADMDSAVRGLLSTGLFDAAERATDPAQVRKEIAEALHPYRRQDGTVWMENVMRYLIARV
ncbi:methyltransferase domain-containing protein [Streptomyces sparsogenes]|uniref:methyltransferase domain-containing protein n=1 Tax=Streptomyces sparsogenes TaxID=67365 RepID=UPI003322FCA1